MIHTSAINNLIKLPDNNVWSAGSDGNIVRWDAKVHFLIFILTFFIFTYLSIYLLCLDWSIFEYCNFETQNSMDEFITCR